MSLNLVKIVADYLQANPEQKFTSREIAEWVFTTYPDKCRDKKERSTSITSDVELVHQLVREMSSMRYFFVRLKKKNSNIKIVEGRPRRYYYTSKTDINEVFQTENIDSVIVRPSITNAFISEHDLYSKLFKYLSSEFGLYSKRIDERRSSNMRGFRGNHWLYPDIVAMEDLSSEWNLEVKNCVQHYSDKWTRLWSFEVKLLINRSNVRECFFQTVSNSSWANFGYLVASQIEGSDTLKELRILNALHGIGFISLDSDNPPESQLLIPARERTEVDWDTINRLTEESKDFIVFIKSIRQFYQTGEVKSVDWDTPND
ncbi:COG2958 family protein [Candidatus Trichorickettsia mobilis]|uniref:COG2958 family protein n=1 Tax=Candidatus Trichorickettsia mobilis TaxID=1346319 RepID=UPI00292DA0DC|nr:hypothetical protein [Candidatus Trichorickettsia mobilis]